MSGRADYRESPGLPPRPPRPERPAAGGGRQRPALDARMRAYVACVVLCGVALSAGALVLAGSRVAFSVAVGAGIAAGNLWLLSRIVAALVAASEEQTEQDGHGGWGWAWPLLALIKMVSLFALVWLLLRYEVVSPVAMLIGFGALPAGIVLSVFFRRPEADPKARKP
ncbi:MAG: ATP synthase subunit I [Myxococcales bacterium]|nr:ATP synthase subunit I [Myxococcales bacterium]